MLVHLAIKDLAVIEATAIDFGPGLNVLTGETGAGKSIVVGALNLMLGDRARADTIRAGCPRAEVQALFRIRADDPVAARVAELDLGAAEPGDGSVDLVIRRVVAPEGRGRVFVNGALVTVRQLRELTRSLVDIASQHEHTALLEPSTHLDLLDRYGDHRPVLDRFARLHAELAAARGRQAEIRHREQLRLEREDFVRFQLDELDRVAPTAGEDEALEEERQRLRRGQRLTAAARQVEALLAGHAGSVGALLATGLHSLEAVAPLDEALGPFVARVQQARVELEDVAFELRRYGDTLDMDARHLDNTEERLAAIKRLMRKHGLDVAALVARAEALREELSAFESLDIDAREADAQAARCEADALEAAERLSEARRRAATRLEARLTEDLGTLAMADAQLTFALERRGALGPDGLDSGEIVMRTNVGEDARPLRRIASGGELSRVLLALKHALGSVDRVATGVFDEVDSGVGGAVAEVIGRKLREIAGERQVIAITHLPQIAALADHHLEVSKHVEAGRTTTRVRALGDEARREEIARMLGGIEITRATVEHAAELLDRRAGDASRYCPPTSKST